MLTILCKLYTKQLQIMYTTLASGQMTGFVDGKSIHDAISRVV
jgi:hypothetical protein